MARLDLGGAKSRSEPTAAELRLPVIIQQATETQSDDGAVVQTWATKSAARARIEPWSGAETYQSAGLQGEANHKIWMRYRDGITIKMRILYGSRVFEIVRVTNVDERRGWLELDCYEVV